MSADYTLFEDDDVEIYVTTKITKHGIRHRIIDTGILTEDFPSSFTTEQLREIQNSLQELIEMYEEG